MAVNIRPLTLADKPVIMAMLKRIPEFEPEELPVAEEVIDGYLADPAGSGYDTFVAEVDGAVAGYVSYGPTPLTAGTWDVYWLAVAPERQGQGVGRALLAFAEAKMRAAQARLVFIETSGKPLYDKTRRFYLNLGWEVVSQIADFYAPGDDKVIFRKRFR